jgi:hypothetical protein
MTMPGGRIRPALLAALLAAPAAASAAASEPAAGAPRAAAPAAFEDVARSTNGTILYMSQDEAIRFCAAKGSHLPSLREYAEAAAALGARGIRETAYKDAVYSDPAVVAERERNGRDGYVVQYRQSAAGKPVVDFYYGRMGYRAPPREPGIFWLWTSSQFPPDSGLATVFDGPNGIAHYGFYHYNYYPVRCAAGAATQTTSR